MLLFLVVSLLPSPPCLAASITFLTSVLNFFLFPRFIYFCSSSFITALLFASSSSSLHHLLLFPLSTFYLLVPRSFPFPPFISYSSFLFPLLPFVHLFLYPCLTSDLPIPSIFFSLLHCLFRLPPPFPLVYHLHLRLCPILPPTSPFLPFPFPRFTSFSSFFLPFLQSTTCTPLLPYFTSCFNLSFPHNTP